MGCFQIFANITDSKLYTALKARYGPDRATFIYQNYITTGDMGELSFERYIWELGNLAEMYSNGEPSINEYERWKSHIQHYNKVNRTFGTPTFVTTRKEFLQIAEGYTAHLVDTIYKKGLTLNDLFDKGSVNVDWKNIYNATMRTVIDDIQESEYDPARKRLIITAMKEFPDVFRESYRQYFETTFGFSFERGDILSDLIEDNEFKEEKDTVYYKNSFEYDQVDQSPNSIKVLIASLIDIDKNWDYETNELGLPVTVDYTNTFNFIHQKLSSVPGEINLMIDELKTHIDTIPALELLINRVNFGAETYTRPKDPKKYLKEEIFRTQFVNQFNKSHNEFTVHFKREDGTVSLINSNIDKAEDLLVTQWQSNFEEKISNDPKAFDKVMIARGRGKTRFLESIGISIDQAESVPTNLIDSLYNYGVSNKKDFTGLYRDKNVIGTMKAIASMVIEDTGDVVTLQHFNAENRIVHGITLNTYISSLAKELAYFAGDPTELTLRFPDIFESSYAANSKWAEMILDGEEIGVGVYDGIKNNQRGLSSKNLKAKDLNIQRIVGIMMEGKYAMMRAADRGVENYFYFKNNKDLIASSVEQAKIRLKEYLLDERDTMAEKLDVVHYNKNNQFNRIFYIENNKGEAVSIVDEVFGGKMTDFMNANLMEDPYVDEFIDTLIQQTISEERTQLENNGVLETDSYGTYLHIQKIIDKWGNVDNVIELFALNSLLGNIEQSKIFIGDVAFYKSPSDLFKRISMLNSTKESARVDAGMDNLINSLEHRFGKRDITDTRIRTMTINDLIIEASEYDAEFNDLLKEVFGDDYNRYAKDSYNKINEGDGFAYMTYDEYRIASIRFGEWSIEDELLYQGIANGDTNLYPDVLKRATVKKYQYSGNLVNEEFQNVKVPAMRKFSVIPLVPGSFSPDSNLAKLNEQMLDNGVGMAFFTSAAKVGHGQTYDMYKGNEFNISLDENSYFDMLDYKYMGNQLKIHSEPKKETTASSQKRKLVEVNLYEDGKPVDEEIGKLLKRYDELQSQLVLKKNTELYTEQDIVEALIQQGIKQGYSTNELRSLAFLKNENGEIDGVIDSLPNKVRIENLLMARLKNNVISHKRAGESLAQVPDIGFEPSDQALADSNRHNLKFYRKSQDGSRLLPMEIMVPLPQELVSYVATNYGEDNTLTQKALDEFNEAVAEDNKIYEETGQMTDLTRATLYIGFRIPNQAASSSDVAKVKSFLPPYMHGSVVVPKPIVAKTGSDFDIDKLNLYKPNLRLNYRGEGKFRSDFMRDFVRKNDMITILRDLGQDFEDTTYKTLNAQFSKAVLEEKEILTGKAREFQKLYQDLRAVALKDVENFTFHRFDQTKEGLENALLDIEMQITLHKTNWKQLLAPLTDSIIKTSVAEIRELRGKDPNFEESHKEFRNVFKNWKNIDKFIEFLSGKGGVGQVAVHITNHVLAQKANLQMLRMHDYFGIKSEYEVVNRYSNTDVKNNPDKIYIFGDNLQRKGTGGQAQIRNNENAFGIATKKEPSNREEAFMTDNELEQNIKVINEDIARIKKDGRALVFPKDGFGTGLAKLKEKAPKTYEHLVKKLKQEFGFDNDTGTLEGSEYIKLGKINNQANQNISEVLSEMLTAYVDIAKDPYILDINAVQSTANVILMMLRWGMDPKTVFKFISQPAIREYVKQEALNNSVVTTPKSGRLKKSDLVKKVLGKFGVTNVKVKDMIYYREDAIERGEEIAPPKKIYDDFKISDLEEGIRSNGKNGNLQKQALDIFLEYRRQSRHFQAMIRATSPDTANFKGISVLESQIKAVESVEESGMFKNFDKMFSSFIGVYKESKEKYFKNIKDMFVTQLPMYKPRLTELKDMSQETQYTEEDRNNILRKIDNEFFRYMLAKTGAIDFGQSIEMLFKGPKSLPKIVKEVKKYYEDNEIPNLFLERILPLINDTGEGFDGMKLRSRKLNSVEKELIEMSFKELEDISPWVESTFGFKGFYKALIAFQLIQTGISNSPFSYIDAIPAKDYFDYIKKSVDIMKNNNTFDGADFAGFTASEPGEFVLHYPEFYTGQHNLPFKSRWSGGKWEISFRENSKSPFAFTMKRMGKGVRYAEYNTFPEVTYLLPKETVDKYSHLQENPNVNIREEYFQLENSEIREINPELERVLTDLMNSIGVNIELVDQIRDRDGKAVNAYAKADLINKVIQLTKGRNITTLPEEVAHMITAMLGKNHPLMKQMMAKIHYFPLYKDVVANYSDQYNGDEQALRFEAVGKMIATHLVQQVPIGNSAAKEFVESWWQRVLRKLAEFFFGKNTNKLVDEMNSFEKVAEQIITGKIRNQLKESSETEYNKRLRRIAESYNMNASGFMPNAITPELLEQDLRKQKLNSVTVHQAQSGAYYLKKNNRKINPVQEFYDLRETTTQGELERLLINDRDKVSPIKNVTIENGKRIERYVYDGRVISKRPSMAQDELFTRNKTPEEIEARENSPRSIISRKTGTYFHEVAENWMYKEIMARENLKTLAGTTQITPTKPDVKIASVLDQVVHASVQQLAYSIEEQQKAIDENGKATVIMENFVIDEKKDIAGTQDVLVIYSDGSVSIYDYKFINFRKQEVKKGKWKIPEDTQIDSIKEKAYDLQISEYKRILAKEYGVKKFRETRVLPFNVQYKYLKGKGIQSHVTRLEGFTYDPKNKKEYLIPLPVAKELTENRDLNRALSFLFEQEEKLDSLIKSNYSNISRREMYKLRRGKLKKSIKGIQVHGDVMGLVSSINETLNATANVIDGLSFKTIGDLNRMTMEIDLFNQLYSDISSSIPKDKVAEFDRVVRRLINAKNALLRKREDILGEINPELNATQQELDFFKRTFGYFSQIDQPIFQEALKAIQTAIGDRNRDLIKLGNETKEEVKALKEWANKRGINLLESYRRITNPKTGNLIGMFSSEFYAQKQKAIDTKDLKWLKENYGWSEEGKKRYNEDLEQFKKSLEGVGENASKIQLERWIRNHNLDADGAYLSPYALNVYGQISKPEKWYSEKYKNLMKPENAGLKRYYDFYRKTNLMFNTLVGERIDGNFVANIRKDIVDSLAQGVGLVQSGRNQAEDFLNSMRVRQNDTFSFEGEEIDIPLLYYDNFMYKDKDGKWTAGVDKKNEDLSNNLILFAESVYNKHHMTRIKDYIEALKLHINNQKIYLTDNMGRPKRKDDGTLREADSKRNAEVFEALTNHMVYGKHIQNKDKHIAIGNRVYSTNKMLSKLMSYMSTKSLAFNYVSGVGNLAAGYTNAYIKGVGGLYYNKKHMWRTHKMLFSRGEKDLYNHITSYFNIEKPHWVQEKAAELSTSLLTKNLTYDKWFLLQQSGDEFIANTILVSMMQNYGLTEDGKEVMRLALLPEGTKSLLDRVKREKDTITVEGMEPEAFDEFRQMVMYVSRSTKGSNTSEDVSMAHTTIYWKAFMHFRNWIAPMIKERFGNLTYTRQVKEWEYGRYKSLFRSIANERFIPNFKNFLLEMGTFGLYKYKGDIKMIEAQFQKFLEENPELEGKIDINQYMELRMRGIRETMHEAKILFGIILIMAAARGDWDDDGIANYKEMKLTREFYKLVNRAYLELSFFVAPTSARDLLKSPIPVTQVGIDLMNFINNSGDELTDLVFPDETPDATPTGHYTKRLVPVAKHIYDFFEDFNEPDE